MLRTWGTSPYIGYAFRLFFVVAGLIALRNLLVAVSRFLAGRAVGPPRICGYAPLSTCHSLRTWLFWSWDAGVRYDGMYRFRRRGYRLFGFEWERQSKKAE